MSGLLITGAGELMRRDRLAGFQQPLHELERHQREHQDNGEEDERAVPEARPAGTLDAVQNPA